MSISGLNKKQAKTKGMIATKRGNIKLLNKSLIVKYVSKQSSPSYFIQKNYIINSNIRKARFPVEIKSLGEYYV